MKTVEMFLLVLIGLIVLWSVIYFLLLLSTELLDRYRTNKILGITKKRTIYVLIQERLQQWYKENRITEKQLNRGIEIATRLNSKEKIDRKTYNALRSELSGLLELKGESAKEDACWR